MLGLKSVQQDSFQDASRTGPLHVVRLYAEDNTCDFLAKIRGLRGDRLNVIIILQEYLGHTEVYKCIVQMISSSQIKTLVTDECDELVINQTWRPSSVVAWNKIRCLWITKVFMSATLTGFIASQMQNGPLSVGSSDF